MVLCPECESDLDIEAEDVEEGDVVECPECGAEYEVVTSAPLELTKINGEDDEEDDEDDDFGKNEKEDDED
jgi:alpha-aminoadipate/glutamate carrier protein LysW